MGKKRKNSNYVTEKKIKAREEAIKAEKVYRTKKITISTIAIVLAIACLVFGIILLTDACAYPKSILGSDNPKADSTVNNSFKVTHHASIEVENYGTIHLELYGEEAPETVGNFVMLAQKGFYDGLTFHRIMADFMIQGGNDDSRPGSSIYGEFDSNGHKNDIQHIEGVISMARTDDPNSATTQFFICNSDAREALDGKYAAFGYVVEGLHVVHKITELGMPKTYLYEYYDTYREIWQAYGNGMILNKADQPVIEYVKILDNYKI